MENNITTSEYFELFVINEVQKTGKEVKFEMMPIDKCITILKANGFEVEEELETNRWDVDFWIYSIKDNKRFLISGSWYYENYSMKEVNI